jgi:hypothetical protein
MIFLSQYTNVGIMKIEYGQLDALHWLVLGSFLPLKDIFLFTIVSTYLKANPQRHIGAAYKNIDEKESWTVYY